MNWSHCFKRQGGFRTTERPGLRLRCVDADKIEILLPTTVFCAWLQPERRHLLSQVATRHLIAARTGATTFVAIIRDLGDNAAHVVALYLQRSLIGSRVFNCCRNRRRFLVSAVFASVDSCLPHPATAIASMIAANKFKKFTIGFSRAITR